MAQKTKTLDEAINDMMKDYKKVVEQAAHSATQEARKDIYKYAMTCIDEYYAGYPPTWYDRSNSLRHAVVPYRNGYTMKDKMIIHTGVKYDPFVLEAYTQGNEAYNGSSHYTPVDPWYVINNYLQGIHPKTNGARDEDEVEYFEHRVTPSPRIKMEKYLQQYVKLTFNTNFMFAIAQQIK